MFEIVTALKYAFSKSKGQRTSAFMIVLGLAVGIAALLVISSIMNGLQTAQLDQLKNLESFDIIIENPSLPVNDYSQVIGVEKAFYFADTAALITDKNSGISQSSRVRGIERQVIIEDERLTSNLRFLTGIPADSFTAISWTMMQKLSLSLGDNVEFTFLKPGRTATVVPYAKSTVINDVYTSSMTDFSSSTVLMDIQSLLSIIGEDKAAVGLFLNDKQSETLKALKLLDPDAKFTTWQEYNRALYSALMLEKTLMFVFLLFMLMIVCVSLKNSTRRLINNKKSEGAVLRALGMSRRRVNSVFLIQGLMLCLIGELIGLGLSYLITTNIQAIFGLVDKVAGTAYSSYPFNVIINPAEALFAVGILFLLAFIFTALGCRKVYKSEIMEVILHDAN